MNIEISELISQMVRGLKSYFENNNIQVQVNFYQELINVLNVELFKPFNEQKLTPTQILNDYIKKELNTDLKITPHDLGDELNNSLIIWGIKKASYFNEK
tara:strand:+ start:231 stop:530 length:300 start_codon:yes stop_codon:yes gene_type:complete